MPKKYNIIVVDDEANGRNGMVKLLNSSGSNLSVEAFDSCLTAIEYLKHNPADIMFTDIKMPFMNGLELSRIARSLHPKIRIVIISAYGEFDFAREAINIGVDDYLLKPVDSGKIITIVKRLTSTDEHLDIIPVSPLEPISLRILKNITPASLPKSVIQCINLVEREYSNPSLCVSFISERLLLSSGYCSQLFKKETNYNLSPFITAYRMEKAKELLVESNLKINSIAANCGFVNITHFTFTFKKYFGVSASAIRNGD